MAEVADPAVLGLYAAGLSYLKIIAVWTIFGGAASIIVAALLHVGSGGSASGTRQK